MPDDTLEMRAARYFGWEDKPRTSIRLNNTTCLIVGEHSYTGKVFLMHYSEEYRPTGDLIKLTERALRKLVETLEGHHVTG